MARARRPRGRGRVDRLTFRYDLVDHLTPPPPPGTLNGYLTIMRNCDHQYTYCIVPQTRGPEVCRPLATIIHEADAMRGLHVTHAATGTRLFTPGMIWNLIRDGRIVEGWGEYDRLGQPQQLGVIPEDAELRERATARLAERGAPEEWPPRGATGTILHSARICGAKVLRRSALQPTW